ncbi:MAG: DUF4300 family protein [Acinetobacter sp.]|nr:DUF4300 family protein [Acinetobacter sp.]
MKYFTPLYLAVALLAACQPQPSNTPSSESKATTSTNTSSSTQPTSSAQHLYYSNLQDEATQNEVKHALLKAGIAAPRVDAFLANVRQFNTSVEGKQLVKNNFVMSQSALPHYDEQVLQEIWSQKNGQFVGYNCRITSYDLMKDLIKIDKKAEKDHSILFVDAESLQHSPHKVFTAQEEEKFFTLYAPIQTPMSKDIAVHEQSIVQAFQARGISFPAAQQSQAARLISVFKHSAIDGEESQLFVGHIGVLVPYENGYLFVEKLAFQAPYQATKFANKQDLYDYLMKMYRPEVETDTALPIVMEDDHLLIKPA